MNQKGEMTMSLILGIVIGLFVVLILIYIATNYIYDGASSIAEFGACEKGVSGYSGICVLPTIVCGDIDGSINPGKILGGCPSGRTREIYGRSDSKNYYQCCVFKTCESAQLTKLDGKNYTLENIKMCLGHADNCKNENQCCCIRPEDIKKIKK